MIRSVILLALAIVVPSSAAAQEKPPVELSTASFSVRPDSSRTSPTVEVDVVLVIQPGNFRHYRLDRRVTDRYGAVTSTSADSRTCPAVMAQLAKVEALRMPTLVAPGSDRLREVPIILHATNYSLKILAYDGGSNTTAQVELLAQSGSPLGEWSEDTLKALNPCWTSAES